MSRDYRAKLKLKRPEKLGLDPYTLPNSNDVPPDQAKFLAIHGSLWDNESSPMEPIIRSGGLIFPYTPSISLSGEANYDSSTYHVTHSIYAQNAYSKSKVSEIQINGKFTSQTHNEAQYLLATIHFLRFVTKSYYGARENPTSGLPPPVLYFDYLGDFIFNNVPVVVSNYQTNFPSDVDYVPVNGKQNANQYESTSYLPTQMDISISLLPHYTPLLLQREFSLEAFRDGTLVTRSNTHGGYL